jgi:hypothetical protein
MDRPGTPIGSPIPPVQALQANLLLKRVFLLPQSGAQHSENKKACD